MLSTSWCLCAQIVLLLGGLSFDPPAGWHELSQRADDIKHDVDAFESADGTVRLIVMRQPPVIRTADPDEFVRGVIAGLKESGYQHESVGTLMVGDYEAIHFAGNLRREDGTSVLFDSFLVLTSDAANNISVLSDSEIGTRDASRALLARFTFSGDPVDLNLFESNTEARSPYDEGRQIGNAVGWLAVPIVVVLAFSILLRRRAPA
ncbi:MAG: hypothetical protein AAF802_28175 [Planctomycetota bacterium]